VYLCVRPRLLRLIKGGHLSPLEREDFGPHLQIGEVQHPQAPILHLGYRLDAHELVAKLLGESRERPNLRPCIGKMVAMRVDDRRAEGPIRAPRNNNEVGLERRPHILVILVGDPERGRRGAPRVPLVEPADLVAALRSLQRVLRPGGLLLTSIRDYDSILASRPGGEAPRLSGLPGGRRMVAQAWEWEATEPIYRLHQFVLREQPGGAWSALHLESRYRALRRSELAGVAADIGFRDIEWLEPSDTRFYQPILAARRSWSGAKDRRPPDGS
jgi:hypothetical protein